MILLSVWLLLLFMPMVSLASAFPEAGTNLSHQIDRMYFFIHTLSLVIGLFIVGAIVLFAVLYRKKNKEKTRSSTHENHILEFTWSFLPFVLFMFMCFWGLIVYNKMRTPIKGALEIHVYGQMWNWDFVYKNGRKSAGTLYVPIDTPVKLVMSSRDVIHSFYVPSFRIKQDVLPGQYTALWFQADKQGLFNVFCTEYCGTAHYNMLAKIHVMKRKDFEDWLATDPYKGLSMAEVGQKVFQGRCTACHQINTQTMIGPGLGKIFGSIREFKEGQSQVADENYIRESILNPSLKIVKGFPDQMTPFAGLLQEEELTGLIEYIKSLK